MGNFCVRCDHLLIFFLDILAVTGAPWIFSLARFIALSAWRRTASLRLIVRRVFGPFLCSRIFNIYKSCAYNYKAPEMQKNVLWNTTREDFNCKRWLSSASATHAWNNWEFSSFLKTPNSFSTFIGRRVSLLYFITRKLHSSKAFTNSRRNYSKNAIQCL